MTLNNTNSKNTGFTLVELLIVIVVIAILAAISLVAYNGIQDRSKTTANAALASTVAKKAEAANTIYNSYPTKVEDFSKNTETKLDNTDKIKDSDPSATATDIIGYKQCTGGGAVVSYWSYTEKAVKKNVLGGGTC